MKQGKTSGHTSEERAATGRESQEEPSRTIRPRALGLALSVLVVVVALGCLVAKYLRTMA